MRQLAVGIYLLTVSKPDHMEQGAGQPLMERRLQEVAQDQRQNARSQDAQTSQNLHDTKHPCATPHSRKRVPL